jgi:lipoprotein signal peptidase
VFLANFNTFIVKAKSLQVDRFYNCRFFLTGFLSLNIFLILSFALLAAFAITYLRGFKRSLVGNFGLFLVMFGGLMNLVQWAKFGCVIDFINFFGLFYFNIYDLMITVGAFFIAISIWKKK